MDSSVAERTENVIELTEGVTFIRANAGAAVTEQNRIVDGVTAMVLSYTDVDSKDVCEVLSADLREVVTRKKALNDARLAITRPMDAAKQAVMELFAPALARLDAAEVHGKRLVESFFAAEQQRRKVEEQRQAEIQRRERERLEAEARERRRIAEEEAAAERKRALAENRRAEEAAREQERQAEQARREGDAHAARELEAQAAAVRTQATHDASAAAERAAQIQETGQREAEQIQQTAAVTPPPIVAQTKVAGVGRSGRWKARVTDKGALIKWVAAHPEDENLLDVNETACNALAFSRESRLNVDGLQAWEDFTISSRGGRRGGR